MTTQTSSSNQTVRYLSNAFANQTRSFKNDNRKGTDLYAAQVDFCFLIDEIQRGPAYMVPKAIAAANALLEQLSKS